MKTKHAKLQNENIIKIIKGQRFQIVLFAVQRQSSSWPPDGRCYYTQTLLQCTRELLVLLHFSNIVTLFVFFSVQVYIFYTYNVRRCYTETLCYNIMVHWTMGNVPCKLVHNAFAQSTMHNGTTLKW